MAARKQVRTEGLFDLLRSRREGAAAEELRTAPEDVAAADVPRAVIPPRPDLEALNTLPIVSVFVHGGAIWLRFVRRGYHRSDVRITRDELAALIEEGKRVLRET